MADSGLRVSKTNTAEPHPSGPVQHGAMGQAERAFSAASTFLSGVLAISATQFLGAPLKLVDPKSYDGYMAWTKESFAVLVTTMTQWWAPTVVRVSGDDSMRGQLYQMEDGSLKCNFPHRLVMMANHQLYTDWLYLWWIAYTNKMHGRIYIILKESLKKIPIFGWGAQFYNFIFLARKWEQDRPRFRRHLAHLNNPQDPMWLLIFPEGTNLSATTREKSRQWAEKNGINDMVHQLLPRSTGLQFCLQELQKNTNWLYDCTIAYEGVPPGQFGQDIFTLRSSFFEGRPPKSVNMYWRRYRISEIPIENDKAFAMWLKNRWTEKDYLLENFSRHGCWPADGPIKAVQRDYKDGDKTQYKAKFIETEVRAGGFEEFMSIFAPITAAATALQSGSIAPENLDIDKLLGMVAQQQQKNLLESGAAPNAPPSQDAMRRILMAATEAGGAPVKKPALQKYTSSQKALQDALLNATGSPNSLPTKPAKTSTLPRPPKSQDEIRQVLGKATAPSGRRASVQAKLNSLQGSTPAETLITRPLSSALTKGAAASLTSVGPKAAQLKSAAAKEAKASAGKPNSLQGKAAAAHKAVLANASANGVTPKAMPNGVRRPSVQSAGSNPSKLPTRPSQGRQMSTTSLPASSKAAPKANAAQGVAAKNALAAASKSNAANAVRK
ncbi:hypothetical protein LTR66_013467 [Elasticomyces elasticus]|nr:hypothetical protein LTR66_013467 [Elasticomyces elasticus]